MAPADLVIRNAMVHTVDRRHPRATAFAVTDGRIVAVGDDDDALSQVGPNTEVRDMAGRFVMPGFTDVHNHHASAGHRDLYEVVFPPTSTPDEILSAVRRYAATVPADGWILGGSWGAGLQGALANHAARHALDEAAGGRPVLLTDDSFHNRWASSRALELTGMTAATPDPAGGEILREGGAPTGVMLENAGRLMERAVPAAARPDEAGRVACSRRAIEMLHSHGITAFQDAAVSVDIMAALRTMDSRGELQAWAVTSMLINDHIFGYDPIGEELIAAGGQYATEHHRPTFVKIFLDGVPPARTASFLQPYLPDDEHGDDFRGEATMSLGELTEWMRIAARAGLSTKVHCTGDGSVHMVLDAAETLRAEGFTDPRIHVAHGQFVAPDDVPRFARCSVDADISPFLWMPGVIPQAIAAVLPGERAGRMAPNRDLMDAGALVAGGSDWPVSPSPRTFEAIAALTTRADPSETFPGTLWPEQAVTREEAIEIFTRNGAIAMGLSDVTGMVATGKSADFIVLDRDITTADPAEVADARVEETYFAGVRVFGGGQR